MSIHKRLFLFLLLIFFIISFTNKVQIQNPLLSTFTQMQDATTYTSFYVGKFLQLSSFRFYPLSMSCGDCGQPRLTPPPTTK